MFTGSNGITEEVLKCESGITAEFLSKFQTFRSEEKNSLELESILHSLFIKENGTLIISEKMNLRVIIVKVVPSTFAEVSDE